MKGESAEEVSARLLQNELLRGLSVSGRGGGRQARLLLLLAEMHSRRKALGPAEARRLVPERGRENHTPG